MTEQAVDPERVRIAVEQLRAALLAHIEAMAPTIRSIAREFARMAEQLREARITDEDGPPAHRDRPAWQSPYGPPRNHRRK